MLLNEDFIKNTEEVLHGETSLLMCALDETPSVSVRFNPFKTGGAPTSVAGVDASQEVAWCRYGRYLARRPSFTTDPIFHAGRYYVQEASSMFVEHALRSVTAANSSNCEGIRLLDLCAAPGGKSTLYSTLVGLEGLVVANEPIRSRAGILADNVRKWGLGNVLAAVNDPSDFARLGEWFDVVAVDAPCSGEGMFRKEPEARGQWSAANVKMNAARQRRILADAWKTLAPGGVLIYSTCTFNREENEDNVEWLAENFDCADAGVETPQEWNIMRTEVAGISCFRFVPHRVRGEGFFCAVVRKADDGHRTQSRPDRHAGQKNPASVQRKKIFSEPPKGAAAELGRWVSQPEYMRFALIGDTAYGYYRPAFDDIRMLSETLSVIHSGVCMGQIYGGTLKPDHSLAMFHDVNRNAAHTADVDIENALRFLRREEFASLDPLAEGLNLITFDGAPIGWAKRIGRRSNNLYPKSLMILSK